MVDKRAVGKSGIEVAPLALGGNVFGWTADETTSFRILDAFVEAGGTMIDTADVYSAWAPGHKGGESERVIGAWLKRNPGKRQDVVVATKVGFLHGEILDGDWVAALDPHVIQRACEDSLNRLGTDCIDIYYQHKDNPAVPLADSLGAMDALVKAGKVRAIALSQFTAARLHETIRFAEDRQLAPVCALQTWYNMVERAKLEGPLLDTALAHGLAVFPFFSLANGFLTGKYRSPDDLGKSVRGDRVEEYLDERGMRVLAALDAVASETGAAVSSVALAWTMAQPGITAAIASATTVEQFDQLTAAMHLRLSADQLHRLGIATAPAEAEPA